MKAQSQDSKVVWLVVNSQPRFRLTMRARRKILWATVLRTFASFFKKREKKRQESSVAFEALLYLTAWRDKSIREIKQTRR